jgi:hypothetical protein
MYISNNEFALGWIVIIAGAVVITLLLLCGH